MNELSPSIETNTPIKSLGKYVSVNDLLSVIKAEVQEFTEAAISIEKAILEIQKKQSQILMALQSQLDMSLQAIDSARLKALLEIAQAKSDLSLYRPAQHQPAALPGYAVPTAE